MLIGSRRKKLRTQAGFCFGLKRPMLSYPCRAAELPRAALDNMHTASIRKKFAAG